MWLVNIAENPLLEASGAPLLRLNSEEGTIGLYQRREELRGEADWRLCCTRSGLHSVEAIAKAFGKSHLAHSIGAFWIVGEISRLHLARWHLPRKS